MSSPSGVQGGAPVANVFWRIFCTSETASGDTEFCIFFIFRCPKIFVGQQHSLMFPLDYTTAHILTTLLCVSMFLAIV